MEFGRVANPGTIDFALPPDNPANARVWANAGPVHQPTVFIGGPIWANKAYVGRIYPAQAKEKDFLLHYVRQFNTIELNLTHYQSPTSAMIDRWRTAAAGRTGGLFTYCPKVPQFISHERMLVATEAATNAFADAVLQLNEHLGMTFLQLPPYVGPDRWPTVETWLRTLPDALPLAVEFRHADWFRPVTWDRTLEKLQNLGRHVVITDVAGRRDVLHMGLSSTVLTLRLLPTKATRQTSAGSMPG